MASGRLELIKESTVPGLGDVPGKLRDVVRDPPAACAPCRTCGARRLLLARRSVYGTKPPKSLRALFSLRGAERAALPDSPLELAIAARYLGVGDPFELERDELAAARGVRRAGPSAAAPLLRCRRAALALPARRDRPRARERRDARRPAGGASSRACPPRGRSSTERVLGIVAGTRRAVCARRVAGALLAPAAQARLAAVARAAAGASGDLRGALRGCLHDPPAGALADAREQLHGRFIRRLRRASRAGRNGWVNGCSCGGDGAR